LSYPPQQQPPYGQPPQPPYGQPPQDQLPYGQQPPPYGQPPQGVPPYEQPQQPGYPPQPGYGQPTGYPPQYGYTAPVQPRWNGLAITGFILSFLISIVEVILCIIALNQINKSGGAQKGRGLAIAGIIIGVLAMIGTVGRFASSTNTSFFF